MTELWSLSAYAIPLIIVVVVLRALFIHRLPKRAFLILWAIALCRLLVPVTFPSPLSVYSLVRRFPVVETETTPVIVQEPKQKIAMTQSAYQPEPQQGTYQAATAMQESLPPERQTTVPPAANPHSIALQTVITVLWLAGSISCAGVFLVTHMHCRSGYAAALPIHDASITEWLRVHPARRAIRILQSDQISAPLTYGLYRPVILLPKALDRNDGRLLSYVLEHEWAHIRRLDVLWKWLLAAAVCLHWCNPFVWVMVVLANRDIEMSCDEAVVRSFGGSVKSFYAQALIGLEEKRFRLAPLCNSFSKTAIEERIISIMKFKKTSHIAAALSMVLIVSTTSAFAFGAVEQTPPTTIQNASSSALHDVSTTYDYSQYASFGVAYDAAADRLYYQGQLIRCFDDQYPVGDGGIAGWQHFTADGTVDVHTEREPVYNVDGSVDPRGFLTGIKPYSQAEFDVRNLENAHGSGVTTDASSGDELSPDALEKEYSIYAPYGITYDKENNLLYYRGMLISSFLDVMASNGEDFSGGKFQGTMRSIAQDGGILSARVIRDYSEPDERGYGKLIKIEPIIEYQDSFMKEADSLRQSIAPYVPYGLSLDSTTNTILYQGMQVRELYDAVAGVLITSSLNAYYPQDAIDAVPVYENGMLIGLRQATQAEYDRRTVERQQLHDSASGVMYGGDQAISGIEWWTAEAYEEWLDQEKIKLQNIIGERAWNSGDGWFIWTQDKVDEAILLYEQILEDIRKGAKVSRDMSLREEIRVDFGDDHNAVASSSGNWYGIVQDTNASVMIDSSGTAEMLSVSSDTGITIVQDTSHQVETITGFAAVIALENGETVDLGTYATYVDRYNAVKAYCDQRIKNGLMTPQEAERVLQPFK